jgi:phytoene dehydrogenase-like protein
MSGAGEGVELAGGERIAAASVLASVTPTQLYGRLLGTPTCPRRKRPRRATATGAATSSFITRWTGAGVAVAGPGRRGADPPDGRRGRGVAVRERGRAGDAARRCPTICVGQPSTARPSRCPEGKARSGCRSRTGRGGEGRCRGGDRDDGQWSEEVRERFADRIEGILARHIRDFDAIKLARRAYSPADLEGLNMNLVGGDPYGGACSSTSSSSGGPSSTRREARRRSRGLVQIGRLDPSGPGLGRRVGVPRGEGARAHEGPARGLARCHVAGRGRARRTTRPI